VTSAVRSAVRPLNDAVLVRRAPPEKWAGLLYIPETAQKKRVEADVLAVGSGRWKRGARVAAGVAPGDRVLIVKWKNGGLATRDDEGRKDEDTVLLKSADVLARVTGGEVEPLFDRVLVRRDSEAEKTEGGIYVPVRARKRNLWATVLGVGPECVEGLRPGDHVLIPAHGTDEMDVEILYETEHAGKPAVLLRERDVKAIEVQHD